MADPCAADTNSVDLSVNATTGVLSAAVRRDPAGAITETASGIKISLATPSGLEVASNNLRIDVQGGGLFLGNAGIEKLMQASTFGTQVGVGLTSVTQGVTRNTTSDIAAQISVNVTNTGDTATRFLFMAGWGVDYQTTFSEFETSNIFDSVYVQLQRNYDSGGFANIDYDGLQAFRQRRRVMLKSMETISVPASSIVSYAVKPQKTGGVESGTGTQGHINGHFGGYISVLW